MRTKFRNILTADNYLDYYFDGELFIDNTPIDTGDDDIFTVGERMTFKKDGIINMYKIKAKSTQKQVGKLLIIDPAWFGLKQKMSVIVKINDTI